MFSNKLFLLLIFKYKFIQIIQMKKAYIVIALAVLSIGCNKEKQEKPFKTAYIDTVQLMKEYTEAKDLEAKYKAKSEEKGRELEAEINRFKQEAANFQRQAQANGQAWAQQRAAELQRREQQLGYAQQALTQELQQEIGKESDSLNSKVKAAIKTYAKEKGYDYVYGTGEIVSVLYAQEKYDITKEMIKVLNEKYKK
jgi:outer membrane protein